MGNKEGAEYIEFQSTRPRGARLSASDIAGKTILVSIHAPTGGATFLASKRQSVPKVSIHAPTGGATVFVPYSPIQ